MGIGKTITAWSLVSIGLLGVIIPHLGFLANVPIFDNLNLISHAVLELISAGLIAVGFVLK